MSRVLRARSSSTALQLVRVVGLHLPDEQIDLDAFAREHMGEAELPRT
jgi:hypothetical protein